jgi:predicted nucleic acid-binding protein
MIALDTNILARFLLRDHERQYCTAVALLQQDRIYTPRPRSFWNWYGCYMSTIARGRRS